MSEQVRVLFDTSVYDYFLKNSGFFSCLKNSNRVVIYGNKVIRDELRDIPNEDRFGERSVRILLLGFYDELVKRHSLDITDAVVSLALEYYKAYSGGIGLNKILSDFLIVANASINNLDLVISNDRKTLMSEVSLRAYRKINLVKGLRTPDFYTIIEFEKKNIL